MLRNIKDLPGFRIAAKDGDIGEVKDFYFDDETWTVRSSKKVAGYPECKL